MVMHTTIRSALAAAVVLAALAGCASSAAASPAGDWGTVTAGRPSLTIESDGSWHGNDGCNAMKGDGKISGADFTFGPFASTLMACEGVTPWLNLAVTAKVDGQSLIVYRGDGTKIGSLPRR